MCISNTDVKTMLATLWPMTDQQNIYAGCNICVNFILKFLSRKKSAWKIRKGGFCKFNKVRAKACGRSAWVTEGVFNVQRRWKYFISPGEILIGWSKLLPTGQSGRDGQLQWRQKSKQVFPLKQKKDLFRCHMILHYIKIFLTINDTNYQLEK